MEARRRPAAAVIALLLAAIAAPVAAQPTPRVRVAVARENLRAAPGGTRIAILQEDAVLAGGATSGSWRAVTLEGWVPAASVEVTSRDGRDLSVRAPGVDIRATPGGKVIARGLTGMLLDQIERGGDWVRVRRAGWAWRESLEAPSRASATPAAPAPEGTSPPAAAARTLHVSPAGATIGSVDADAEMEIVGRDGEWARVRVEGWTRMARAAEGAGTPAHDVSLESLRSDPEAYRGRLVAWRVRFVELQRADSLRTDLERGEAYMLARDPGGEPGFVYVTLSGDQIAAVRRLVPLQAIEIVARVRSGSSPLMGHPILELVELR